MYLGNFRKFLTFSMCSKPVGYHPTNQKQTKWQQMVGQLKLTMYLMIYKYQCENWKCNKNF